MFHTLLIGMDFCVLKDPDSIPTGFHTHFKLILIKGAREVCCEETSGANISSSTVCLLESLSRFFLKPFGCSRTVAGLQLQLPLGYFFVNSLTTSTYALKVHMSAGKLVYSSSNAHTCEAALCGLCQFWPAVSSLLHMYEGRDRTEHYQWACHCSSLPQKQLTHLYLADESQHTQKEGSWTLPKAIVNISVSLFFEMRAGLKACRSMFCCVCVTNFI